MPESRGRSVFWPMLLILAGAALLAQQVGWVQWRWEDLLRLWPILLILAGLDILIGRSSVGGVVLLILGLTALLAIVLLFGAIGPVGRRAEIHELSFPRAGVESAAVRIDAGLGRVRLEPLSDGADLFQAQIALDRRRGELLFEHTLTDGVAQIRLGSRHTRWTPWSGPWADGWQIALAPEIPLRLAFNGGVNAMELHLEGLALDELEVAMGVGSAHILLPSRPGVAHIQGGVGSLVVEIPEETPARILATGGLGSIAIDPRFQRDGAYYVSETYRPEKEAIEVTIRGGIGSITVR
jgi:hypothetical protein